MSKVAVVTGGNRGIGFETVRLIAAQKFQGTVYLTARNEEQGKAAADKITSNLGSGCATVQFHQLDVTDEKSVETFKNFLKQNHDGIDILVNNAGILLATPDDTAHTEPNLDDAKKTLEVNYYGVKRVTEALLPLLKPHSRVVINASRMGNLRQLNNEDMRQVFLSSKLSVPLIEKVVDSYIKAIKDGKSREQGFPAPYAMSKVAIIAYSRVLQKRMESDGKKDILVNACCPGLVATDMTQPMRDMMNMKVGDLFAGIYHVKSVEEGADTLVYLALLPEGAKEPKGQFVGERKVLNWAEGETMDELQKEHAKKMKENK